MVEDESRRWTFQESRNSVADVMEGEKRKMEKLLRKKTIKKLPEIYFSENNRMMGNCDEFLKIPGVENVGFSEWEENFFTAIEKVAIGWRECNHLTTMVKVLCENKNRELLWAIVYQSDILEKTNLKLLE